jgi:hypothetical protein
MRRDQPSSLELLHALIESPLASLRKRWLLATPTLVGIINDAVPLSVLFAGMGFICGFRAGVLVASDALVASLFALAGGALGVVACRGLQRSGAGPWQRLAALIAGSFIVLVLQERYLAP